MTNPITKSITKRLLDREIKELEEEKRKLLLTLNKLNKTLMEDYEQKAKLDEIKGAKIKIGDIIEELKNITASEITNIEIRALEFFYDGKTIIPKIEETNDKMSMFGSSIDIDFENNIGDIYVYHIRLFNDLNEIQADGKTLLEHCTPKESNLVVDKDIEEVIGYFDLEYLEDNWHWSQDKHHLLEQAVYRCIKNGKTVEIIKKENQKTLSK